MSCFGNDMCIQDRLTQVIGFANREHVIIKEISIDAAQFVELANFYGSNVQYKDEKIIFNTCFGTVLVGVNE